jgi:hypothetical protein
MSQSKYVKGARFRMLERERRIEVTARVYATTGDLNKALLAAGYKPTANNLTRQRNKIVSDPRFKSKLMELLAEAFPVNERSSMLVDLIRQGVDAAKRSDKVSDIKSMVELISKISGVGASNENQQQLPPMQQVVVLPGGAQLPQQVEIAATEEVAEEPALSLPKSD